MTAQSPQVQRKAREEAAAMSDTTEQLEDILNTLAFQVGGEVIRDETLGSTAVTEAKEAIQALIDEAVLAELEPLLPAMNIEKYALWVRARVASRIAALKQNRSKE